MYFIDLLCVLTDLLKISFILAEPNQNNQIYYLLTFMICPKSIINFNRMNFFAPNLPKPTPTENKFITGFQNTLRLLKNILTLTKKIFML